MNTLHRNDFVGAVVPDFYTAKDPAATTPVVFCSHGRALAYRLRDTTAAQRAAMAADVTDDIFLWSPTDGQIAALFKISISTLAKARALTAEKRVLVAKGQRPLATRRDRVEASVHSDLDIVFFIDTVGFERVFNVMDRMTLPTAEAAE